MEGKPDISPAPESPQTPASPQNIVRRAYADLAEPAALPRLRALLGDGPFAKIFLFVASTADFAAIIAAARHEFADTPLSACTTAGEISPDGYSDGGIVAVALPAVHFNVRSILVENLSETDQEDLIGRFIRHRHDMAAQHPTWGHEFAFAMIDGLSTREEVLLQALSPGLGGIPLFGGSAGDGAEFGKTWVAHDGRVRENAAVISLVRTCCPVKVFSLDHFSPADYAMVVTKADPEKRTVSEINAEPALSEYARSLGLSPQEVTSNTFASSPLVVRVGDTHHVRSILRGDDDGTLEFASAIDVGLVLRSTISGDIETHLSDTLANLARPTRPDVILACDCLWRRVEIGDKQATRAVSKILSDNKVIGFNTYGEQIDAMHVNHTLTGVAIYPPPDGSGNGAGSG
ncbi:MAG: GfdT protein [Rhodobacteraceae bacterium]|nr:MAG: GfdT protein [Paracoccaceae bacterium]